MKRVLVSDNLAEAGLAIFREAEGIELDVRPGLPKEELLKIIGDYHGLAVRSGTKVTAEVIDAAVNLEVIGRAGTGVDNVDLEAASKRGIVVMNTPGGNTITTAEHTVAMMMSVSRNIPQATASLKAGRWEKKKFEGRELYDKTLGVVGLGNIGLVVADRALGLKMKVVAYDPYISEDAAKRLGIELADLDAVLRRADYLTVHVPLNAETRGIIGTEAIAKMKDGVFILNCARGGIVDELALAEALGSGKVAGAAFDVFEKEPPAPDHPLLESERFICTPHLGASTEEAQVNVAVAVARQMVAYLTSGIIQNAVNVPSVSREVLEVLGPWLELARRLGAVVGQLGTRNATELRVITAGALTEQPTKPLALAALAGMLQYQLGVPVNEVNAVHLAKERGLNLVEQTEAAARDFASLLTLELRGPEGIFALGGTLFGRRELRVVRFDGFTLEAVPEGHIIVMQNEDRPGVVGQIGTILGQAGINISQMQLSLDRERGQALAFVNVDTVAPPEIIEKLRAVPHMVRVDPVQL